jgi:hypothetical protein
LFQQERVGEVSGVEKGFHEWDPLFEVHSSTAFHWENAEENHRKSFSTLQNEQKPKNTFSS